MSDITELLGRWRSGERQAFDELVPRVYAEMRAIAANLLRGERPGHVLETSALVHEAYLRLIDQTRINWNSRGHFFGAAAVAMRRILVDQARRRLADKRGAGAPHDDIDLALHLAVEPDLDVLALNQALDGLMAVDPELGRLVELRYFTGLTLDETAEVLGVSPQRVGRDWAVARSWLARQLGPTGPASTPPAAAG